MDVDTVAVKTRNDEAQMRAPDAAPMPGPGEMACAVCGRDLWWTGQPPDIDGDVWICGECDAARNFDSLEDC